MLKKKSFLPLPSLLLVVLAINVASIFSWSSRVSGVVHAENEGLGFGPEAGDWALGPYHLVKKEERRPIVSTEYGDISAVRITDKINGTYLLHFFTLHPNALYLPVLLHADMIFYVHTGSGRLSWTEEDELKHADLRRGDVHRLRHGTAFFIQSFGTESTQRQKLRIHAIFANSNNDLHEPSTGPYFSIRDLALGFDRNLLQAAFKVPEVVIGELFNGTKPPAIIHGMPETRKNAWDMEIEDLIGSRNYNLFQLNKKKGEGKSLFNFFNEDKDFENCNGWSTTVARKKSSALRGSDISVFMVNLTIGSMMGPHWNPRSTEIVVVLRGRGMVRVVCPSSSHQMSLCRNASIAVEEGDVFAVPRYHPMAQMAFNNETFVFMGFTTSTKRNRPQFLAGEASVLQLLDRDVLAMAFNVSNTTLDHILAGQRDSVILGCVSCAEEEYKKMEEATEREREETPPRKEEKERKEEEPARRQEEETRRREEEAKRREEEETRQSEEEREPRRRQDQGRRSEAEEAAEAERRMEEEARREEESARQHQKERGGQEDPLYYEQIATRNLFQKRLTI